VMSFNHTDRQEDLTPSHGRNGVSLARAQLSTSIMSERKTLTVKKPSKRLRFSTVCSPSAVSGFCSAMAVLASPDIMKRSSAALHEASSLKQQVKDTPFQITLTVVGWKFYKHLHASSNLPTNGAVVSLKREPDNEHDPNAIAVLTNHSLIKIGHLLKDDAALFAPHIDTGAICVSSASIRTCLAASFTLSAEGVSNGSETVLGVLNRFHKVVDMDRSSLRIAASDVERSRSAPYVLQDLKALPWNPLPGWEAAVEVPLLPWANPFDVSKLHAPPLTVEEIQKAQSTSWPPSDDILLRLGMAPAHNEVWYHRVAGLRPPAQWKVAGALDVLPHIQTSSQTQTKRVAIALEGSIHGVTEIWHSDTLEVMRELMHESNFWCRRSGDALIRSFGGPYCLGQEEEKLKLVRGTPHTELTRECYCIVECFGMCIAITDAHCPLHETEKMCAAHNLVYAAVHLVHPVAPGFNTLIFGCNLRGSGFHYHQDSIPDLKAKNAPLVPRQPVVTTVFYENPKRDSEKEMVLWKPLLNFSPINNDESSRGEYLAARAVSTTHGMIHVQRSGLQKSAVHGIFHAPGANERQGYRVAITARITKPDAAVCLRDYENVYCAEFGPNGDVQLPR
jgi:hypothetical protein